MEGLAAGADDYLTKPFHNKELVARVGVGRRIIGMHREIQEKNALLEAAARTDFLTGLANRRAVEEYAAKQLGGAIRHQFPLWAVLADLNNFKMVNDRYGHLAGDEVLRRFAALLKKYSHIRHLRAARRGRVRSRGHPCFCWAHHGSRRTAGVYFYNRTVHVRGRKCSGHSELRSGWI